jgi:subfamily B ATP-binding cassette protein HlyB/CyaB
VWTKNGILISKVHTVWILGSLCRFHRIPFDVSLLLQRHPPETDDYYALSTFLHAVDELGFHHGESQNEAINNFASLSLPCLAFKLTDENTRKVNVEGSNEESQISTNKLSEPDLNTDNDSLDVETLPKMAQPLLIAREDPSNDQGDDEDVLHYFEPGNETSQQSSRQQLMEGLEPVLYLFTPKPEAIRDEDGIKASKPKSFGFSWFIPEIFKHRKVWRDVLIASLVLQLVGLATPLFTQVIIDKVIVHQTQSTLIAIGVGLMLAVLFTAIFTWVRQYLVLHTGNRIDAVLGSRVFSHLLKLPIPYFANRPTGTMVARLNGIEAIRQFLTGATVMLLLDLPFMIVLLSVMFWYSWQLSLIAVGLLALLTILSLFVTPMFRERLNQQFLLGARNQAFVTEYVAGIDTVKALQLEPQLEKKYGNFLADFLAAGFDTKKLANHYNTIASALEQIQTLSILIIGALLVMQNDGFTIGMLVAFQMFASRLSQPILSMVGLYQEYQQANLSVQRLGDLMDAPAEPYSILPTRSGSGPGNIVIDNVSFRYSEDHLWLYRDLSFTFLPGKTTLIMGPSGSGKSTLAKLLLGFYRATDGQILLDGQDIRHFSANELRTKYGIVPQETRLFSGTVYENLHMANPLASFEEIIVACRWAEIHDVIEKLPQGYQTELGENGVGLSGGQKQRIAIARALLKRPRVLIFDEAVSNLDSQTAEQFAKTINKLKGKVTMLFITHQVPHGLHVDEVLNFSGLHNASGKNNESHNLLKTED